MARNCRSFPASCLPLLMNNIVKSPQASCSQKSRGTLFVVGDEGDICALRTDGTLVNKARIRKTDLEGITSNPVTGSLYALDDEGYLYIAEDSGNIIKYTFPAMPGYQTSKKSKRAP